jgi:hypothetical protein
MTTSGFTDNRGRRLIVPSVSCPALLLHFSADEWNQKKKAV